MSDEPDGTVMMTPVSNVFAGMPGLEERLLHATRNAQRGNPSASFVAAVVCDLINRYVAQSVPDAVSYFASTPNGFSGEVKEFQRPTRQLFLRDGPILVEVPSLVRFNGKKVVPEEASVADYTQWAEWAMANQQPGLAKEYHDGKFYVQVLAFDTSLEGMPAGVYGTVMGTAAWPDKEPRLSPFSLTRARDDLFRRLKTS